MLAVTSGRWVPIKPEGAPYWGIHTDDGRTIAGTSSGLSEGDARLICELHNTDTSQPALARELPEVRRVTADDIDAMLAAYQAVAPAPRDMKVRRMEAAAFALRDRLAIWRASDGN